MLKHYSHIRMEAKRKALESSWSASRSRGCHDVRRTESSQIRQRFGLIHSHLTAGVGRTDYVAELCRTLENL